MLVNTSAVAISVILIHTLARIIIIVSVEVYTYVAIRNDDNMNNEGREKQKTWTQRTLNRERIRTGISMEQEFQLPGSYICFCMNQDSKCNNAWMSLKTVHQSLSVVD